jgi:hypothetical protein
LEIQIMAKKILVNYDFAQNEIQNAKAQNLASAPSTPASGQFWYNTTTGKFEYRGATANIDPTDRANHTGTQTASTISDFASAVRSFRLDEMAAPQNPLWLGNNRLGGLAEPVFSSDAATKNYVDNAVNGLDWKQSVRVATTQQIDLSTFSSVGASIDGIMLSRGDRFLVKNQTNAKENGIYVYSPPLETDPGVFIPTPLSRASDAQQLSAGATVMIEQGNVNADTQWRIITDGQIVIGDTDIVFTQIGSVVSYGAGTGIAVSGNTISIDTNTVPRKYVSNIGGAADCHLTHNLGTQDVVVSVKEIATNQLVECSVRIVDANIVTISFAEPVTYNSMRAIVIG